MLTRKSINTPPQGPTLDEGYAHGDKSVMLTIWTIQSGKLKSYNLSYRKIAYEIIKIS